MILSLWQAYQTHQKADGQRGKALHQDPEDTQRDAGQKGLVSGVCE